MIEAGWLEEAKQVIPFKNSNALRTVGYQELFECLEGRISMEEAINQIQQNTRRYAKRQMTWIRNQEKVYWINPEVDIEELVLTIKKRLA
jgi:tRNA dimethylallyltransferase